MKNILLAGVAALGLFASCEQPAPEQIPADYSKTTSELNTFEDSVSFVIGTFMGNQILQNVPEELWKDSTVNREAFFAGFNKFIADKESGIDEEAMRTLLQQFGELQQKKAEEQMISDLSPEQLEHKAKNEAYLEENKAKEGYEVTSTGLQYKVITQGTGEIPTAQSVVKVHYTGKTIEGKVFDSSVERGAPAEFPVGGVIKGWTEALQFMAVGSKYELVIPQDIAYGARGAGQDIAPFSTLIFEVELLEIVKPAAGHEGHAH